MGRRRSPRPKARDHNRLLALRFIARSSGVQMADLVAYVLQRGRHKETHPDAQAGLNRLVAMVTNRTITWREPWPRGV